MNVDQEPLGLRCTGFSPELSLLMPTFSLPWPPPGLAGPASSPMECSPTTEETSVHGFGATLMPENYRRRVAQPVSYYALFK